MRTLNRLVPLLLLVAGFMFVRAPFLIADTPEEAGMGLIYKIFFFHVPSGMTAMLSAFVCGAASLLYLRRRSPIADHVALAAAELVVVFGAIVLVTGPLWARKSWSVWWAWEARLVIMLVMWMVFVAYLILRRFGGAGSDVLAGAVGLFGAVLVPFVYYSVDLWQAHHPKTSVVPTLPPSMMYTFAWCAAAFAVLYLALLVVRVRLESSRAALEDAYLALEE